MPVPQILEVVVSLIVIYYLLGSVVSLITQWINEAFETRGRALRQYLIKIVGENKIEDLLNMPQLQALRPIRYKSVLSVFGSSTEPKLLEKIPVAVLVDTFFDLSGLTARKEMDLLELAELIDKLPDSEGKNAFISWINQGVTNLDDLRMRTSAYFTGMLEQAAATFRARARSIVIILSIGITLLFGADSIQLVRTLWTNTELRAVASAKAAMVVQQEGTDTSIDNLIQELGDLTLRFGWWQTQQYPQGPDTQAWALFIFFKALGLGVTATAVSQGSSFWYDLLKKITSPAKSSGADSSQYSEARG